jgi:hypothetical protein
MQSQPNDRPAPPTSLLVAARLPLLIATLLLALAPSTGCDTVAEITFIKENLTGLTVLGLRYETCAATDPLATCVPPSCGQLDFVMETNLLNFVTPNQQLDSLEGRLTPGTNFGASTDIRFEKTWLFQLDAKGTDKACVDVSDCADGFECRALANTELPGDDINIGRQVCVTAAQLSWQPGSLSFTALDKDPQPDNSATKGLNASGISLAINVDNSASLLGQDLVSGSIDNDTATDLSQKRFAALKSFRSELLSKDRSGLLGRSEFALLNLSTTVSDVFKLDNSFKRTFISDGQISALRGGRSVFDTAVDNLALSTKGTSPIWEGLLESARFFSQVDDRTVQPSFARRALLFADSPSDGSAGNVTEQNVIAAFTDDRVKARAYILHLDSLAPRDPATLDKRTGPSSAYQSLTCETGGYYIYDVWPESLANHMRRLGRAFEGVWSVQIQASALIDGKTTRALSELPPGWYRLTASMSVSVGDRTQQFQLAAIKDRLGSAGEYSDFRLLFEVPAP